MDRNCLSYWFPKLQAAGLPVPRTEIVRTEVNLIELLEGNTPAGWGGFLADLNVAIGKIGGSPCFLRTGQGSGKHQWKRTCYLDLATGTLPNHIARLVEWSETVDFIGLPSNVWVVRELLPTEPLCVLPAYGDMPLVPEARCFVKDGNVLCWHPYWPINAIRDGFPVAKPEDRFAEEAKRDVPANFEEIVAGAHALDMRQFLPLAERAAVVFAGDGAWSVDLLPTRRGWFVTDMAIAQRSFHWEGCPIPALLRQN